MKVMNETIIDFDSKTCTELVCDELHYQIPFKTLLPVFTSSLLAYNE